MAEIWLVFSSIKLPACFSKCKCLFVFPYCNRNVLLSYFNIIYNWIFVTASTLSPDTQRPRGRQITVMSSLTSVNVSRKQWIKVWLHILGQCVSEPVSIIHTCSFYSCNTVTMSVRDQEEQALTEYKHMSRILHSITVSGAGIQVLLQTVIVDLLFTGIKYF